ncbi:ArnT family glycosyltransferase [Aurantibacillus circumpalustris]|uniref:ArnT family glycosyltransferase n=1 Tax=Aurantibacillus circumpalustris TaxID=3036359 RepID=UPI00295C331F|nr:glycosyltransferase family 39 protein [Aurantibacillus circumpalustris]
MVKFFDSVFKKNIALLLFVIILFFLNFYSKTIFYRPGSIHQWRQTDCLSITKNYYEEGMHFLEPKIHYQGSFDGKAVSEFPILNYTVAFLWKIFGEHEFIYRLLEYLIFITAMFVLFNTMLRYYRSTLFAFFSVSIFLTSPLLAYYSLNFIADVPALSIGIIAFCLFLRFYTSKQIKFFYFALLLATLAVLIKASALIALCVLLFFALLDILGLTKFFKTEKLFENKKMPLTAIVVAIVAIFSWYRFALAYNNNNSNNIFLLTLLPAWEMGEDQLIYNLKFLFNNLFPIFLNRPMFFLFMALVIFVTAKYKELSSFLRYCFVFSALFFAVYILLFFQVFSVHDYYLSNLMIFPVITFLCTAHIVSETNFFNTNKSFVRLFVICVILFNSMHSAAVYRLRTVEDDKLVYWFPFITEDESKLAKYLAWDYGNSIKRIEEITPDLRSHGIKREDFVLAIPDQSFDISLYFMDQKGFPISRDHFINDTTVADQFLKKHVKYLVMCDTTLKQQIAFKRIANHFETLFTKNSVEVFKLK